MHKSKSTLAVLLLSLIARLVLIETLIDCPAAAATGVVSKDEVCDSRADYFLGIEDYPNAVKLHRQVITTHPRNALAHYHLGFAYGILGKRDEELAEYLRAASLGLKQWDLFLNLGLAYLEDRNLQAATGALETAVKLGPRHSEAHFNLGLVYERRGMLAQARQEMLASLELTPNEADALNMLGVIEAEDGDCARARQIWSVLARTEPGFEPARANLAILDRRADPVGQGLLRDHPAFRAASSDEACGNRDSNSWCQPPVR